MLVPNKYISLNESVLGHLPDLLLPVGEKISLKELYHAREPQFECIDHFLYALDMLYVLGKITVDFETGTVSYAY